MEAVCSSENLVPIHKPTTASQAQNLAINIVTEWELHISYDDILGPTSLEKSGNYTKRHLIDIKNRILLKQFT
jgi:hypothetical protein